MKNRVSEVPSFCLTVFLLPLLLYGLEISDPGQVVYKETRISAVVEHEVTLPCGTTLPDVYIWSFTQPGTDKIQAVVYNFGKGPKLQHLAQDLGDLDVVQNSSSLSTKNLLVAAEGLYTCQALYDSVEGAKLYYYYVRLRVLVPVTKPYVLWSNSSAVEGLPYWMRCGLKNGTEPITYKWEQESRSGLVTTLAETNQSLINIIINRNNTGWYRCLAKNEVNQERSDRSDWLDVLYGPDLPQVDVTAYSVTERGSSALEKGNVSFRCQASSNPASQYSWLYNNIEFYTGPQLNITNILRGQAGYYTCLAQNTLINTQSKRTITLTVYYPPDGTPSCTIFPANNYTDLALFCSWGGGYPAATLKWTPNVNGAISQGLSNFTQIQAGSDTINNTIFTCYGSHAALNTGQNCSTRTCEYMGKKSTEFIHKYGKNSVSTLEIGIRGLYY
uniref:Ig-like domain-containing protein n=1 Tax=Astyanax mexicanus TaxID=7994 RepID=A0A3B1JLL6_ASTMX